MPFAIPKRRGQPRNSPRKHLGKRQDGPCQPSQRARKPDLPESPANTPVQSFSSRKEGARLNRGGKRLHGLTQCNESAAEDRRIEPVNDLSVKRAGAAHKGSRSHHDEKVRHDPPRRNESAAEDRRTEVVKDPSGKPVGVASVVQVDNQAEEDRAAGVSEFRVSSFQFSVSRTTPRVGSPRTQPTLRLLSPFIAANLSAACLKLET